jgi:hypothetical protein
MTNVVKLLDNIQERVEEEIIRALENRVHWVSEPFILLAGERGSTPNVSVFGVIQKMIREGKLNKTYLPASFPNGKTENLPHYRLAK